MSDEWKPSQQDWRELMKHVKDSPTRTEFQVLKIQVQDMHNGFFNGGCASQKLTRQRLRAVTWLVVGMWSAIAAWIGWLQNYTIEHVQKLTMLLTKITGGHG